MHPDVIEIKPRRIVFAVMFLLLESMSMVLSKWILTTIYIGCKSRK